MQYPIGEKVIVRSVDSGVHYGTLCSIDGSTAHLQNSRRLWLWHTGGKGISLSEIAIFGINHEKSKITETLPDLYVLGICEIIPTHGMAQATIEGAAVAEPE